MSSSQSNPGRLLSDDGGFGRIIQINERQLDDALSRLLMVNGRVEPAHVQRFRDYAEHNRIHLNHCWGRVDAAGRIRQTVLAIKNPGRTAMMFASHPEDASEIAAMGELIDHGSGALAEDGVRLAQALLQPEEVLETQAYLEGGFNELAMLSYLERPVPERGEITPTSWPNRVTIESYRESRIDDFCLALDRTYAQTLDCPELRGLRETTDILEGHRGTGTFDPALWMLMRMDESPMGLILLNVSPAQKTIELVYFGLAADARGKGLGGALLRHGLNLVAGREERTINLAVDERNKPALKLYARAGFQRALRRIALIRPLP